MYIINKRIKRKIFIFIENSLTDRRFIVEIAEILSHSKAIINCVPQSSILSFLLLYIIVKSILYEIQLSVKILIFIDDSIIFVANQHPNITEFII